VAQGKFDARPRESSLLVRVLRVVDDMSGFRIAVGSRSIQKDEACSSRSQSTWRSCGFCIVFFLTMHIHGFVVINHRDSRELLGGSKSTGAAGHHQTERTGHRAMPEIVAIILATFWLLGLVSSYTLGGYIHALLAIAVVVVMVPVIRDEAREPLEPPDVLR
jgi:Family of unknown function (DUF5670)